MKQKLLFLIVSLIVGGVNCAWADCSVNTDSYGKTQIVWDFGVVTETQRGEGSYYLNASTNAYVSAIDNYTTTRPDRANWVVAQAQIAGGDGRSIYKNGEGHSDKGTGVALGADKSGNWEGQINFWAPVSGTLSFTGVRVDKLKVYDKGTSGSDTGTPGTVSTGTCSLSIVLGHRYQIYVGENTSVGVATMTLTSEGYGTDNVTSGTMDFSELAYFLPNAVVPKGTYVFTSNGYKAISDKEDVKDALVVYTEVTGGTADDATIDISTESYRGVKIGGNSKNEYNYTTSKHGYLTITFNYGGNRGNEYFKNAGFQYNMGSRADKTTTFYLAKDQRIQVVAGTQGIYIKSLAFNEVSNVSATLGSNGYATFASGYPLDLTAANLPSGIRAYKAAVSGTTVTFTALDQTVPANTGILLKGEAGGSYDIPVAANSTTVTENAFLVNAANKIFTGDNNYYYFGLIAGELTFGTFDPSSVAIPASKAYLKVLKSSIDAGARLSVAFADDETTGIADVRGKQSEVSGEYFNLSGQRVSQPAKGLYIVNGKKVIIK